MSFFASATVVFNTTGLVCRLICARAMIQQQPQLRHVHLLLEVLIQSIMLPQSQAQQSELPVPVARCGWEASSCLCELEWL